MCENEQTGHIELNFYNAGDFLYIVGTADLMGDVFDFTGPLWRIFFEIPINTHVLLESRVENQELRQKIKHP